MSEEVAATTFSADVRRRLHQAAGGGGGAGAPFGEMLANTGLCWAANGPYLEVLSLSTGERRAQWTFGLHLTGQLVQITCVNQWAPDTSPLLLLVGLDCGAATGGMLCVFDICAGLVRHAVHVQRGVTSVSPVTRWPSSSLSPEVDPPAPASMVSLGTQDGLIFLVHLSVYQLDSASFLCDEQHPAHLLQHGDADCDSFYNSSGCDSVHIAADGAVSQRALVLNRHAVTDSSFIYEGSDQAPVHCDLQRTWVSCLQFVLQLDSLVVGYSFGGWQLWSLDSLQLQFASRHESSLLPMLACVFLEPENDPRHYVYLWTVFSVPAYQDVRGSRSVAALYSLLYRERHGSGAAATCTAVGPRYGSLLQADMRLVYQLTTSPQRPRPELVSASCLLSARQLDSAQLSPTVAAGGSTRCALLWEAWSNEQQADTGDSHTILAVFDLNDWYAAHLPTSIESARRPFFRFLPLNIGRGIAMDARVTGWGCDGESVSVGSGLAGEQVRVTVLLDVGVERCGCESLCARVLRRMESEPASVLTDSATLYSALLEGEKESTVSVPELAADVDEPQRDALLTLALRAGSWSVLTACAGQWASDFSLDSPLRWLLDWSWRRAVETVSSIDALSCDLFDPPPVTSDAAPAMAETLRGLHEAQGRLSGLVSVLGEMLAVRECTEAGLQELQSRCLVLRLRRQHCQLLSWLLAVQLLPELSDHVALPDKTPEHILVYPCSHLVKWYSERRRVLSTDLLMVEGLLDDMGEAVRSAWCEEQDDACYPPRSLETATRVYLLDSVTDESRHRFTYYLLLDLRWSLGDWLDAALESFASVYALGGSAVRVVQGFWLLDHGECDQALTLLLDPGVSSADLNPAEVRRALRSLLAQGAPRAALHLSLARFAGGSVAEDVRLHELVLLENTMLAEAVRHERRTRDVGGPDQLLWLLQQVEGRGLLLSFSHLMLDQCQSDGLVEFLRSSRHQACRDLLYTFLVARGRYAEACQLQRAGGDDKSAPSQLRQCVDRLLTHILPLDSAKQPGGRAGSITATVMRVSGLQQRQQSSVKQPGATVSVSQRSAAVQSHSSRICADLERDRAAPSFQPIYQHSQTPFRPRGKRRRAELVDTVPPGPLHSAENEGGAHEEVSPTPRAVSAQKLRPAVRHLLQTPPVRRARSLLAGGLKVPAIARLKFDRSAPFIEHTPQHGNDSKRARVDVFDGAVVSGSSSVTAKTTEGADNVSKREKSPSEVHVPTIFTPGRPSIAELTRRSSVKSTGRSSTNRPSRIDSPSEVHVPTIFTPGRPNISQLIRRSTVKKVVDSTGKKEAGIVKTDCDDSPELPAIPTVFTPGKTPLSIAKRPSLPPKSSTLQSNCKSKPENQQPAFFTVDTHLNESVSIPTVFSPKLVGSTWQKSVVASSANVVPSTGTSFNSGVDGAILIERSCNQPAPVTRDGSQNVSTVAAGDISLPNSASDESDASFHSLNASARSLSESGSRAVAAMETSPVCPKEEGESREQFAAGEVCGHTLQPAMKHSLADERGSACADADGAVGGLDCVADSSVCWVSAGAACLAEQNVSSPIALSHTAGSKLGADSNKPVATISGDLAAEEKSEGSDTNVPLTVEEKSGGAIVSVPLVIEEKSEGSNTGVLLDTEEKSEGFIRNDPAATCESDVNVSVIDTLSKSSLVSRGTVAGLMASLQKISSALNMSMDSIISAPGEDTDRTKDIVEESFVVSEEGGESCRDVEGPAVPPGSDLTRVEVDLENLSECDDIVPPTAAEDGAVKFSLECSAARNAGSDQNETDSAVAGAETDVVLHLDTSMDSSSDEEGPPCATDPDCHAVDLKQFGVECDEVSDELDTVGNVTDKTVIDTAPLVVSALSDKQLSSESHGACLDSGNDVVESHHTVQGIIVTNNEDASLKGNVVASPARKTRSRKSIITGFQPLSPLVEEECYQSSGKDIENSLPVEGTNPVQKSITQFSTEDVVSSELASAARVESEEPESLPVISVPVARRKRCHSEEPMHCSSVPERRRVRCHSEEPDSQLTPRRSSRLQRLREVSDTSPLAHPASPRSRQDSGHSDQITSLGGESARENKQRCGKGRRRSATSEDKLTSMEHTESISAATKTAAKVEVVALKDSKEPRTPRRRSMSVDATDVPLTPKRKSTVPATAEASTPKQEPSVFHTSEKPSTPRRRSMAHKATEKTPSPQTPRRSSRRRSISENKSAASSSVVGALSTVSESGVLRGVDDKAASAASCEEHHSVTQKGTPGPRGSGRTLRRRSTDSLIDSPSTCSEAAKANIQQHMLPLSEIDTDLGGAGGSSGTVSQCATPRRSSRIRQLSEDVAPAETTRTDPKVSSPALGGVKMKAGKEQHETPVPALASAGQDTGQEPASDRTSTGSPQAARSSARKIRSTIKTNGTPSSGKGGKRRRHTTSSLAQPASSGSREQECDGDEHGFSPIRLLSADQRNMLLNSGCSNRAVESPAARLRRAAVKKALRQKSLRRQSVKLW